MFCVIFQLQVVVLLFEDKETTSPWEVSGGCGLRGFICCHGNRCVTDPAYEEVNNSFERSLVFLHRVRYTCTCN